MTAPTPTVQTRSQAPRPRLLRWSALIFVILAAHIALWLSDTAFELKLRLTIFNAAGWTTVLAPIWLVGRWLKATEERNAHAENTGDRQQSR